MNVFIQIGLGFGVASIACTQAKLKITGIVFAIVSGINALFGLIQLTWGA